MRYRHIIMVCVTGAIVVLCSFAIRYWSHKVGFAPSPALAGFRRVPEEDALKVLRTNLNGQFGVSLPSSVKVVNCGAKGEFDQLWIELSISPEEIDQFIRSLDEAAPRRGWQIDPQLYKDPSGSNVQPNWWEPLRLSGGAVAGWAANFVGQEFHTGPSTYRLVVSRESGRMYLWVLTRP